MTRSQPGTRSEAGVSLIELLVGMMIAAAVGAAVVTWMSSAATTVTIHREDDRAVQDLRHAKDRLTREVRMAAQLLAAAPDELTLWVDDDSDGSLDPGETVTWAIEAGGDLVRSTDAGDTWVVMSHLVAEESGFTFDAESVAEIRTVGITLVASSGQAGATRSISTQIFVRNAS
jgi:type II secretory pathway pseudopilin PulG